MVFTSPSWVPQLSIEAIPDSIPIFEYVDNEKYGRHPIEKSFKPYTCGISGKSYTYKDKSVRSELLARALKKELQWYPNEGTEWDRVMGIFSVNTVDSILLCDAIHRLSGVATPANAAYSAAELEYQLKSSGATALTTCAPLLETALQAAKGAGIPESRVYLLPTPGAPKTSLKTIDDLIEEGRKLEPVEKLQWTPHQGKHQTAFLCYSSGTSGLPKGVMISHHNVISNIAQVTVYQQPAFESRGGPEVCLGLLPFSHIYGLVVIALASVFRGDGVIVLPKFELEPFLQTIAKYKINCLYVVPPIIIQIVNNPQLCSKYDLSSIESLFTGAAPLGAETAEELQKLYPNWKIRQGYGLTETSTVMSSTYIEDIWFGSSGSLLPLVTAKIVAPDGTEIEEYDKPGELVVQSPSVVLGYLNNVKANRETFLPDTDGKGRWMRTGDEAVFRKGPKGHEHVFIVDRIKELIKVKGLQVAPAELEAHLLTHPSVADCAVIPVPDDQAGEVPKAFVVKAPSVGLEEHPRLVARDIIKHVQEHKARHKWLKGGVEFVDAIPKSPSGKILRRLLRDQEREARRKKGSKL